MPSKEHGERQWRLFKLYFYVNSIITFIPIILLIISIILLWGLSEVTHCNINEGGVTQPCYLFGLDITDFIYAWAMWIFLGIIFLPIFYIFLTIFYIFLSIITILIYYMWYLFDYSINDNVLPPYR